MNCDNCIYYIYDDIYDFYYCDATFDEDEIERIVNGTARECPYFRDNDDYKIVKKQN